MKYPDIVNAILVRQCFNNGDSIAELALAAKRSPTTIRRWLKITNRGLMPARPAATKEK